ncbi:MAG: DJ-1/PfpI family protein [Blastocatellia bacterium]|nr:DJ-1/PfpI family protein [Blastocatellia bacterium]
MRKVAILIFDEAEVLDFCGPFEVFSVTGRGWEQKPFEVFTVAEKSGAVTATNGLSVNPRYTIEDCPRADILIVPGGMGTRREMRNQTLIDWIKETADKAEMTLSVCTGSLLLAKAGLLDGASATTHWAAIDLLREVAPGATILPDKQFVDNGRVMTSAGISAGIDLSLHAVAKLLGEDAAATTARWMEYKHWKGSEYWLNE